MWTGVLRATFNVRYTLDAQLMRLTISLQFWSYIAR